MTPWADMLVAGLWQAGWAVMPVALVVAAVGRFGKCNATTRHALWLTTFAAFIAAMWLPGPTVDPPPAPEPVYFVGSQFSGDGTTHAIPFVPVVRSTQSEPWRPEQVDKATTAQVAASAEPTPPRTAACSADSPAAWLASTANRLRRLSIPLLAPVEQAWQWVCKSDADSGSKSSCDDTVDLACASNALSCDQSTDECTSNCSDDVDSPLVNAASSAADWFSSLPVMIAGGWSKARGEMTDALAASAMAEPPSRPYIEKPSQADIAAAISMLGSVRTTSNPEELDPWPGEGGSQFSARAEWQRFMSGLLGVRDAVGRVPPLPTTVWAVGFISLAGLLLLRTISAARRLQKAEPADAETLRLVEREARRLGMKSVPQTLLIDDRVSPLIWCGQHVQLILPRPFWSNLDYDARRAVICHELAHIRRRDHWVRRLEIIVTCLYWWHPVMWWVKARMAEEADACCDEWVTWVLPRERRAYARALLAATDYVSGSVAPKPFAVAMASARAAKIARRLTMIMTATRRPSLGLTGICGVFALAALAWVATPAQSCPPEEQDTTKTHNHQHAPSVQTVNARNTGETGDGPEEDDGNWKERADFDTPPMADRIRRIEESQKRLAAELRELSKHLDKHGGGTPAPPAGQAGNPFWMTTPAPAAPAAGQPFSQMRRAAPGAAYSGAVIAGPRPGFEQPIITRSYKLSGDRLEALTELMVRDDVPVLVTPTGEGIEVHGTESQQAIFAAFIKMITANEKAAKIKLPNEKLEAVKKLAALESVPTRFHLTDDSITVEGSPAEQAVFDAFIALIHPKTNAGSSNTAVSAFSPVAPVAPVAPPAPGQPAMPAPDAGKHKPGKAKSKKPAAAPGSAAAEASTAAIASAVELDKARAELELQLKANQDAAKNDLVAGRIKESLLQYEQSAALLADLKARESELVAKEQAARSYTVARERAELEARLKDLRSRRADLTAEQSQLEGQADHLEAEADAVAEKAEKVEDADEAKLMKRQARDMRNQAQRSRRNATRLERDIAKLADAIAEMEIQAASAGR